MVRPASHQRVFEAWVRNTGDPNLSVVAPAPAVGPVGPPIDWDNGRVGTLRFSKRDLDRALERFAVGDANTLLRLAATLDDGDGHLDLTEMIAAGRLATEDLTRGFAVGPAAVAEVMRAQKVGAESLLLRLAKRLDDGDRILSPAELGRAADLLTGIVPANDVAATFERLRSLAGPTVKLETLGEVADANRSHPILALHFPTIGGADPELNVCITGGVHGNEPAGTGAATMFAEWLASEPDIRRRVAFTVVPMVNPRGLEDGTRRTPENVDTNRSFGPNPEHETAEAKIIIDLLKRSNFDLGIDLHSGGPQRNGFWLIHENAESLLTPVMAAFDVEWPVLSGDVNPYTAQRPGILVSKNKGTLKVEFVLHGARWAVTVEAPRSLGYLDRVVGEVELIHRILGAALGLQTIV